MFKVGEEVVCINSGGKRGLVDGEKYEVLRSWIESNGREFVSVLNEGRELFARRFMSLADYNNQQMIKDDIWEISQDIPAEPPEPPKEPTEADILSNAINKT